MIVHCEITACDSDNKQNLYTGILPLSYRPITHAQPYNLKPTTCLLVAQKHGLFFFCRYRLCVDRIHTVLFDVYVAYANFNSSRFTFLDKASKYRFKVCPMLLVAMTISRNRNNRNAGSWTNAQHRAGQPRGWGEKCSVSSLHFITTFSCVLRYFNNS